MAIDVLKKVTQGAVKGAMAAGAAAMGAAQTPYQAELAAAQQPTYQLPANWFNGMSRMNADSGWTIDDSDSSTWKQIEQMYKSGNTQGAINLMNQLSSQGKFGGYWADDGTYYGFAQGYTGGANASMQPVIGNQILTPNGLKYENTTAWLTPDGKVLNLGEGGRLTNNGETWGTTNDNSGTLTGKWFQENGIDPKDVSATTWTAWAQQQGWTPEETMMHMAEAGAFTNPELNTPEGNQKRLAELQANPNADPAAIAAVQQVLNQQLASSGGTTIYQEMVNQADAGGTPTGGTPSGGASGGSYSSGGAGAFAPEAPPSFDEWKEQNGISTPTLTAPEAYDPNSDPYWLAYQEQYGNAQAPEWTGGEFNSEEVPEWIKFQEEWGDAQAPEWTGDPNEAKRDEHLAAAEGTWGGSPYEALRDQYLRNAANTKWNYNPDTDPVWQAYQKQYRREGQRATEDTMGRYAAMTGGMPSTAAVSAASQAGNYYASQLSDKLPQLYQDAYNRYLDEYKKQLGLSEAYGNLAETEYGHWFDSQNQHLGLADMYNTIAEQGYGRYKDSVDQFNKNRDFAYNMAMDAINMSRQDFYDKYGMYQDEVDQFYKNRDFAYNFARDSQNLGMDVSNDQYKRYIDLVNQANYENEMNYKKYRDTIEDAWADREYAQKLLEYADSQGWKWREWNQYLTEYGDQLSQKEREWAYKVMRDQVNDEQDAKEMELAMAQLGAKYGDYTGLSGLGIDTSNSVGYNYAYSADGSTYDISSQKGMDFLQNAPIGATMTGGDGSKWTKNADGTTTITKNGKTWTYGSPAAPATSGSGKSSGTGSGKKTGSGSGSKSGSGSESETDALSSLTAAGIKSEGEAYNWLLANGYGVTAAGKLAKYYAESLGAENGAEGEAPADQTADYRNLTEALDRMAQNGRSRDEIYTEINAAVRDGLITKEQGEALKNNYYGTSDNVPNSNQTHSGGRPQSQGFNSVYQAADSYFSRGDRNKAIQAISDAYNAGKIHEYEIDIIMDRLGL